MAHFSVAPLPLSRYTPAVYLVNEQGQLEVVDMFGQSKRFLAEMRLHVHSHAVGWPLRCGSQDFIRIEELESASPLSIAFVDQRQLWQAVHRYLDQGAYHSRIGDSRFVRNRQVHTDIVATVANGLFLTASAAICAGLVLPMLFKPRQG